MGKQDHQDFKAQWDSLENMECRDRREILGPRALQDFLVSEVTKAPLGPLENLASQGKKASLGLTELLENLAPKVMQGILACLVIQG